MTHRRLGSLSSLFLNPSGTWPFLDHLLNHSSFFLILCPSHWHSPVRFGRISGSFLCSIHVPSWTPDHLFCCCILRAFITGTDYGFLEGNINASELVFSTWARARFSSLQDHRLIFYVSLCFLTSLHKCVIWEMEISIGIIHHSQTFWNRCGMRCWKTRGYLSKCRIKTRKLCSHKALGSKTSLRIPKSLCSLQNQSLMVVHSREWAGAIA